MYFELFLQYFLIPLLFLISTGQMKDQNLPYYMFPVSSGYNEGYSSGTGKKWVGHNVEIASQAM